ncbi:uncharacterized protein BDW47DRAFT_97913 [Aspergillus candidus]|uniref:Uncharacterized protein n=1 Tax=Aspergillus candidus TaxID=41067 RepID=A0A2I2FNC4_ASPCN|nr:hypothetical protein BDW47DRAFT_97913 [Aspergillus candidus]PLB42122.1 hypothetical protein BDW47DRAFT_97913 [Aspergillus candidus]
MKVPRLAGDEGRHIFFMHRPDISPGSSSFLAFSFFFFAFFLLSFFPKARTYQIRPSIINTCSCSLSPPPFEPTDLRQSL